MIIFDNILYRDYVLQYYSILNRPLLIVIGSSVHRIIFFQIEHFKDMLKYEE